MIPLPDTRLTLGIGNLYLEGGKPKKFEMRLERLLNETGISYERKFEYAQVFFQYLNNAARAEEIILSIIEEKQGFLKGYYWLFNFYNNSKNYDKGLKLAQRLSNLFPEDQQAKALIKQFQKTINDKSDSTRL